MAENKTDKEQIPAVVPSVMIPGVLYQEQEPAVPEPLETEAGTEQDLNWSNIYGGRWFYSYCSV